MQGRLVSSQSWYKSARFENKIQNENYQKVIILRVVQDTYNCSGKPIF